MRFNYLNSIVKAAVFAVTVLLLTAGVSSAQTATVTLNAGQQTVVLPDGNTVPMWGWTCGDVLTPAVLSSGATCTSLSFNTTTGAHTPQIGGVAWQPPLIVVPYTVSATTGASTANLAITLVNNLPVETSIMILGQVGGGLGGMGGGPTTGTVVQAGPVREAGPRTDGDHQPQTSTTWTTVVAGNWTPPGQSARARSFVPEIGGVATVGTAAASGTYTWTGLAPGTYLIRTGTYPSLQGPMGLYGVLVVTQAAGTAAGQSGNATYGIAYPHPSTVATAGNVTYDADVVALESELDARQNKMVAANFPTACTGAGTPVPQCTAAGPLPTGAATANTGFSETAKWTSQCNMPGMAAPTCYPPAVDYTPLYYLMNGIAFSKDAQQNSALTVPSAGATGNVLVRFVNAGSRMHTPSVNNLNMLLVAEDANVLPDVALALGWGGATAKTLSAKGASPTAANCTTTVTVACGLNVRTEVFQPAGKVMDVLVSPTQTTAGTYDSATYLIYDHALEALTTDNGRDGGMQIFLDVNDTGAAKLAAANKSVAANPDSYQCAPGVTLVVSDIGKGVLANDFNAYGATLAPPNNLTGSITPFGSGSATDTLTFNANGTFTYTQAATNTACGGSFTYLANGVASASVTISQSSTVGTGPIANPDSFSTQSASLIRVGAPGVLANDHDPNNYPMSALGTGTGGAVVVTAPLTSVQLNSDGSFTAQKTPGTACPAGGCTFLYQAKNSQNSVGNTTTVTLNFKTPSNLIVKVSDALTGAPITDFKWIIEQDLTQPIDPLCQVNTGTGARPIRANGTACPAGNPPTPATNFHTSYMPVIAEGCTGAQSCSRGQTVYDNGTPCTTPGVPAGCSLTAGQHVAAACDGYGMCTIGAAQLPASTPDQVQLNALNPDGSPATYYISILSGDSQNAFAYGFTGDPTVTNASGGQANCTPASGQTEPTGLTTSSICSHTMGGGPVLDAISLGGTCTGTVAAGTYACTYPAPATGQGNVNIKLQPAPLKTATVTAFIFEDDYPLNGEPDTGGGVDTLATLEVPLGDFAIQIWDDAGGVGDFTGQMTYDMFNMPLTNALNGTIDPNTGNDACPISNTQSTGVPGEPQTAAGVIVTCPQYESDGKTPSPLTGQVVVKNLMQGKFSLIAHPGAAREAAGEEWLQTNSLDGGHFLDSFLRVGEPPYFQEYGPGGWHVFMGFANPAHINARLKSICAGHPLPNSPFTGACRNTLNGQVTNLHQSRSPNENLYGANVFPQGDPHNYAPLTYTNCYAAIGDTDGATIALAKCDPDGNFSFVNIPDGDYGLVVFDQWDDFIVDGSSRMVSISGGQTRTLTFPTFTWQAHLWSTAYMDTLGHGAPNVLADGSLDPMTSPGLIQVPTRIRHVNGKIVNSLLSDIGGFMRFDETFPLFAFYTVESDNTRFRGTGVHVVNDAGGAVDGPTTGGGNGNTGPYQGIANTQEAFSLPGSLSVPGAVYCGSPSALSDAQCATNNLSTNPGGKPSCGSPTQTAPCQSTGAIYPGSTDVVGWQGGVSEFERIDWGKTPYILGENGGIRGRVVNNTTRNFDDIRMQIQNLWEPLVPRVTINLYQEGTAPDGTMSLTLVDTTTTDSWDDWAQGFGQGGRTATTPNLSCTGQDAGNDPYFVYTMAGQPNYLTPGTALPYNSQYKCYDGYHNLNQIQPAPYDGQFRFPSPTCLTPGATFTKPIAGSTTGQTFTCATVVNPAFGQAGVTGLGAKPAVLPPGKYVVEVVPPPGWQFDKEEDLNLLIGDQYIATVPQQFPAGIGAIFITPDQASIDAANPSYTGPYTASNPYNKPWTCTGTPGTAGYSCTLTPNTTNNGKQPTDYGRTTFGVFAPGGLQLQSAPCAGKLRIVPDYLSISPESGEVAPFAGALHPLCDRKEITLSDQMQANLEFNLFTNTPKTTSFTGFISDDFSSEFDPAAPAFGEKFAIPNVPVSIKDFNGQEISRVYSDQWGTYNGLVYSTWEVDPPNITGFSPNMMITCMNDPGPIMDNRPTLPGATAGTTIKNPTFGMMITDPLFNPGYSTFCYENPFMPGDTTYLDTPVIPVSAFAEGYNPPDCSYPDGTPMILSVLGDAIGTGNATARGPWVSAATHTITINALAPTTLATAQNGTTAGAGFQALNHAYSGPAASTMPYNQKTVTRHYGFGTSAGTVGLVGSDGVFRSLTGVSWSDAVITGGVPSGLPNCALLETNIGGPINAIAHGGKIPAQCGELVITTAAGKKSIDTVTVTVQAVTATTGPNHNVVSFVAGENVQGNALQTAIDNAFPGDLIIVGCHPAVAATSTSPAIPAQTSCSYNEAVLMWKPVRLQGIGDGAVKIDANMHPAGTKLEPWRRQVNCLFGLALNGGFINPLTNPYDVPTDTANNGGPFTCSSAMQGVVQPLPGEPVVGWDATLNGNIAELLQEPTLMGAYEGAGITVLAAGLENNNSATCNAEAPTGCVLLNNSTATGGDCAISSNPFYATNYKCNPSRIDGLSVMNSSQGGGGIFLHGYQHFTEVSNNHVANNGGTLTGGITVGQMEVLDITFNTTGTASVAQGLGYNTFVTVHNNNISNNAAYGDELNSNTPSSAGGMTICPGADNYKATSNWVCGNLSTGDGGGMAHHGFSINGDIENNWFLFNQSHNPTLVTNGGGLIALGSAPDGAACENAAIDFDCPPALTDGIGPGLKIMGNVFQGNTAEQGQGGGLALLHVNGNDVLNNPSNSGTCGTAQELWYCVTISNNLFANNIAGWTGGGVSLLDAVKVTFNNNTVASNDSTATAGVVFNSNGAPNGNVTPPGQHKGGGGKCDPTTNPSCTGFSITTSEPLPAGLVTEHHSANLSSAFTSPGVNCGAYDTTAGGSHACTKYSVPVLNNDIFWQNRAFYITTGGAGGSVQLNPVVSQTTTGACVAMQASSGTSQASAAGYWDIGVYNDFSATDHSSGLTLNPTSSVLSSGTYGGNSSTDPAFTHPYCNGSRVPPEIAPLICNVSNGTANAPGCIQPGTVGLNMTVPGGVPDSLVPPLPVFSISTAATVDEGSNWINMLYGPLTLTCPITTSTGTAGTCGTVATGGPLGDYRTSATPGAHLPAPYPNQ